MGYKEEEGDGLSIIQYWHDGAPPDYIQELLDSFREHNPELRHLVFDEHSAAKLIAERLGERELAAFRSCAVPAMQADYFRYCAALALGGLCCDADIRCVANMRSLMPAPGEGWLMLRPHGAVVNGLFAMGSAGNPLLALTVELATTNIEARRFTNVYAATGPALWTALHWANHLGSFDALIERAPDAHWKHYARSCSEAIGSFDRVICAFRRIRIKLASEFGPFIRTTGMHFPYKETGTHWGNFEGDIYRRPAPTSTRRFASWPIERSINSSIGRGG